MAGEFLVFHLPGFDPYRQGIFHRRERAGSKVGIGAGGIMGEVEIEPDATFLGKRALQEAPTAIGRIPIGGIPEGEG